MRKDWLWIGLASALLAACTTNEQQPPAPAQPAYNGPVVEIPGVEPKYEPINPGTSQDYSVNGKSYRVIKDPSNYSETGLATYYGDEASGNRTATGERFDPDALTAAHPTLPLPGYVRVTNLANGRQIVLRINDRGPYTPGRIIDLSQAAANRLNVSGNSRVRVDYIKVAPDGSLSGPGTIGTRVVKQNFALPARPDIAGGMTIMGGGAGKAEAAPAAEPASVAQPEVQAVDNSTLQSDDSMGAPVRSSGFLGAPQPLRSGVLEGSDAPAAQPTAAPAASAPPVAAAVAAPATTRAPASNARPAATGGSYVVQVGALSDAGRARQLAQSLGKRFGVPGSVDARGNVYRVQLGRFSSRQQASALQQRLAQEAQQQSFVTTAP